MAKLHEVLAVEGTVVAAADQLVKDTSDKFGKDHFFTAEVKTLKMLTDSPANLAEEIAARSERALTTTVRETLEFMFQVWERAEDVLFQKNLTNTTAFGDIEYRGKVIATGVPVDELMGLEARLGKLRNQVLVRMPTLDASKVWAQDVNERPGVFVAPAEVTTKTSKTMYPVVLAPATDKHPAQVKEATKDEVVGTFQIIRRSGAATAVQKSEMLLAIDDLIAAIKQARMRANNVDVKPSKIAKAITDVLMATLK